MGNMTSEILALIPARFQSTRFPGKPLTPLLNRPMIQWVYENIQSDGIKAVVVTDDERIETAVRGFGGEVVRVDDAVTTGSERIQLAYERHFSQDNFKVVINVQGDEPLLKASELKRLAEFHLQGNYPVSTWHYYS